MGYYRSDGAVRVSDASGGAANRCCPSVSRFVLLVLGQWCDEADRCLTVSMLMFFHSMMMFLYLFIFFSMCAFSNEVCELFFRVRIIFYRCDHGLRFIVRILPFPHRVTCSFAPNTAFVRHGNREILLNNFIRRSDRMACIMKLRCRWPVVSAL